MKKRGLLFASVLVIGMGMSMPACAEGLGGLLGSLFSDDASVENLFGEDGVVSNLLNDEKTVEAINGLFGEGGALSGVLPENVDVSGVLQSVNEQLEDPDSTLNQGINNFTEMAKGEDGAVDWGKVGSSVEELIGLFAGGGMSGESVGEEETEGEDFETWYENIMLLYGNADAAMYDYIAEKNADVMDAGDAQIFSKRAGYMSDIEQDEVKILGDFTQVNYSVDGDQMKMTSAATDTLLLTLTKNEDGTFAVTDEKQAADGEEYDASLEALCQEVGIPVDDFYASTMLGAYNDADALAEYLDEHPEIAAAEFQGEQLTAEELRTLSNDYIEGILNAAFGTEENEEMTEDITE